MGGQEECDDGNDINGDGCDSHCRLTGCGNGLAVGDELCDDGNDLDGDGCDNTCEPTLCAYGTLGIPRQMFPSEMRPYAQTRDIDRDGQTDLLLGMHVWRRDHTGFRQLANEGDQMGINSRPQLAFINGDQHLDLVQGGVRLNRNDDFTHFVYYPGRADGSFGARIVTQCRTSEGWNMWSADRFTIGQMNDDGFADIFFFQSRPGNRQNLPIKVCLGNAESSFDPPANIEVNTRVPPAVSADLNGDGLTDFITVNPRSVDQRFLWFNDGVQLIQQGLMSPVQRQENGRLGRDFSDGIPFDFDGDGDQDLCSAQSTYIRCFINQGNRGFKDPLDNTLHYILIELGAHNGRLTLVDLNRDSLVDLVTGHHLVINHGDGNFEAFPSFFGLLEPLLFLDVDGDGNLDAIDEDWSVSLNRGAMDFAAPAATMPDGFGFGIRDQITWTGAGDTNGDGHDDLVGHHLTDVPPDADVREWHRLVIYTGDDEEGQPILESASIPGVFQGGRTSRPYGLFETVQVGPEGQVAVFTDGGVRSVCDAAACAEDRCALPPEVSEESTAPCQDGVPTQYVALIYQRGEDGRLTPPKAVGLTGEANIPMRDNQPADAEIRLYELNGDGQLDMVVTNGSGHRDTFIGLSNENGALSFRRVRNNAGRSQPRLGDLNGDGRVDILWPERGARRVYWGRQRGLLKNKNSSQWPQT